MDRIHIMPPSLADKIAAGEVVERPASVVKELVENALDAHATSISVEIRQGGKTFIRVTDNGYGMTRTDARNAFLPHATSKISEYEDLDSLKTYGFRGEALAAISAVSRIELVTHTDAARNGVFLSLEAGKIIEEDEVGAAPGTTIIVRDLFFNTPARMSFLKKDKTEAAAIATFLQNMAIGRYDISFSLVSDGRTVFRTNKSNDMKNAIHSIYGAEMVSRLMPVKYSYKNILLNGYIDTPAHARLGRNMQLTFLNGRLIRSKVCYVGLDDGFAPECENTKHPACFINYTVDPSEVDVNVHPAKTEVRFLNEGDIILGTRFAIQDSFQRMKPLYYEDGKTVSEILTIPGVKIDPAVNGKLDLFEFVGKVKKGEISMDPIHRHEIEIGPNGFDAETMEKLEYHSLLRKNRLGPALASGKPEEDSVIPEEDTKLVEKETADADIPETLFDDRETDENALPPGFKIIGEIFQLYCIVEHHDEIVIIDKHAAHEKMLYNKLVRTMEISSHVPAQILLTPVVISLSAEEMDITLRHIGDFVKVGMDLDECGPNQIAVKTIPMHLPNEQVTDIFFDLLKTISEKKTGKFTDYQEKFFRTIACRSAIKAGKETRPEEMGPLVARILSDENMKFCPHGRPIYMIRSKKELDKLFKRIK